MKYLQALLLVCLCISPSFAENFLVLPFFSSDKSNNLEWVGESISETIREALASEGVLTLDRDAREEAYRRLSLRPYSHLTKATVMRLAESLDADQVIFGKFEVLDPDPGANGKTKGTLRINAEAINLKKARLGPEYAETGALEELARLQTHLAWQSLQFVRPERHLTEE